MPCFNPFDAMPASFGRGCLQLPTKMYKNTLQKSVGSVLKHTILLYDVTLMRSVGMVPLETTADRKKEMEEIKLRVFTNKSFSKQHQPVSAGETKTSGFRCFGKDSVYGRRLCCYEIYWVPPSHRAKTKPCNTDILLTLNY